jgi:hypothetical protein
MWARIAFRWHAVCGARPSFRSRAVERNVFILNGDRVN